MCNVVDGTNQEFTVVLLIVGGAISLVAAGLCLLVEDPEEDFLHGRQRDAVAGDTERVHRTIERLE